MDKSFKIDINKININQIDQGLFEISGLDDQSKNFIISNYQKGTEKSAIQRFSFYMKNILMGWIGQRMSERKMSLKIDGEKIYMIIY
jgi:hypothetical protein